MTDRTLALLEEQVKKHRALAKLCHDPKIREDHEKAAAELEGFVAQGCGEHRVECFGIGFEFHLRAEFRAADLSRSDNAERCREEWQAA